MDYKQKFVDNTRDQINTIANKLGYQALYNAYSKDSRQLAFAEQILGVGQGGLATLAAQRDLDREQQIAQINSTNRANRPSGGGGTSGGTIKPTVGGYSDANGKPLKLTATQVDTITGFDNALAGAEKSLSLMNQGVKTGPFENLKLKGAKLINKADESQLSLEQSLSKLKADFMKSLSGAAVSESEAKRLAQFLPEFGDQEQVIKSKLNTLKSESVRSKENFLKTLGGIENKGNTIIGPDGNEYEFTN